MDKKTFGSVMELMEFFKKTGGQGGKAAAKRMTKAERSERARLAGKASGKARAAKAKAAKRAAKRAAKKED